MVLIFFIVCAIIIFSKIQESFRTHSVIENISYDVESPYQRIEVSTIKAPSKIGKCMILGNEVQLCSKDEHKYHELMVHFPIYYLDSFQTALIVGGGDLMNLREIMKYETLKKVVLLELDQEVVNTAVDHFGVKRYENDPRVHIIYGDAAENIELIGNTPMDLVILDLTEDLDNNVPVGKVDFILRCKSMMSENGVFVMNGRSNEKKLKNIFKYAFRYGCYLKTFEEYYEFVICSDVHNFPAIEKKSTWWKDDITTRFYKRRKHAKYFNWYSVSENTTLDEHLYLLP